jgi:NAD(P)-dependent dehydrogenase (short-subunit alcohol dehydrogenase family)
MYPQRFSLADKTALVLGGSSGIGRHIALGFQEAGAHVTVVGRTKGKVEEVLALLNASRSHDRVRNYGHVCDLSDASQLNELIGRVVAQSGSVDILVNSQGITNLKPAEQFTRADYDALIAVNLTSVFFACVEIGRHMLARGSGTIINITSVAAYRGVPLSSIYTISKHGVLGVTETLAAEWATRGVRVNAIAPGFFVTDLNRDKMSALRKESALRRTPMHRFGELEELVGAAIFLASAAASYITGETVRVDGGFLSSGLD